MRSVLTALLLAAGSGAAVAQTGYTFEMRLIADGEAGAPTSPNYPAYPLDSFFQVSRIGFWLQARVAVTGNAQNWGIVRAASPAGGTSFIELQSIYSASLSRGSAHAPTASFGRGMGYRNGGAATGNTGNTGDSQPFPGVGGNENGGLDNGGSGELMRRVYGFDSWVGATRPGDGDPDNNPWGINGGAQSAPMPSDGTFSPWASLYRIWVDIPAHAPSQPGQMPGFGLYLSASAYLTGSVGVVPTDGSFSSWQMQEGPGQFLTASWGMIPTPSAATAFALGALAAAQRRRT
jgi:hypothetical protein